MTLWIKLTVLWHSNPNITNVQHLPLEVICALKQILVPSSSPLITNSSTCSTAWRELPISTQFVYFASQTCRNWRSLPLPAPRRFLNFHYYEQCFLSMSMWFCTWKIHFSKCKWQAKRPVRLQCQWAVETASQGPRWSRSVAMAVLGLNGLPRPPKRTITHSSIFISINTLEYIFPLYVLINSYQLSICSHTFLYLPI